jgi:hypothetical protein
LSITVQLDFPEIRPGGAQLWFLGTKRMTAMLAEEVRRRRAGQELKEMLEIALNSKAFQSSR